MIAKVRRHRPVRRSLTQFLTILLVLVASLAQARVAAADQNALPDFPVANGHFYSQASGRGGGFGFAITDDEAPFYRAFVRLGGASKLGYPASQRFLLDGLPAQATQRAVLQWQPARGEVVALNIFDIFTSRGLDGPLRARQIPPTQDNTPDTGLPWPAIVQRHLVLLDADPAIKARYFADPDPIQHFGLPQGVGAYPGVFVIRFERATFQHWRVATPFARPGEITLVNAGDLAKEVGLVPTAAQEPTPASQILVTPLGAAIPAPDATQASARASARIGRRSLVRLDVTFASGRGVASGILLDRDGDILTNEHVVDRATAVQVTFASGVSLPAQILGVDLAADLAVVRVAPERIGDGVAPAHLVSGATLVPGQAVVALGFSPFFPMGPATRLGVYQQTLPGTVDLLRSDTYILPGDSGGMLLDLQGNVVGINDEVRFTREPGEPLIALSIDAAAAEKIARRIIRGEFLRREIAPRAPGDKLSVTLSGPTGSRQASVVLGGWPGPTGR